MREFMERDHSPNEARAHKDEDPGASAPRVLLRIGTGVGDDRAVGEDRSVREALEDGLPRYNKKVDKTVMQSTVPSC